MFLEVARVVFEPLNLTKSYQVNPYIILIFLIRKKKMIIISKYFFIFNKKFNSQYGKNHESVI